MQIALFALGFVLALALWRIYLLEKRLRIFWPKGDVQSVEALVREHTVLLERFGHDAEYLHKAVEALGTHFLSTVHKVEIVRFNPFADSGGDQSFTVAMLDGYNNGYILSSFFTQGRPMVYAKPIEDGKSKYALSDEEQHVLSKAIQQS